MTALFGAHVKVSPRRGSSTPLAIGALEKDLYGNPPSRRFGLHRLFYEHWDDNVSFPDAKINDDISKGRIPWMSVASGRRDGTKVTWNRIASGAEDAVIDSWASKINALATTGYFTYCHEADSTIKRQNFASAFRYSVAGPEFAAAFRRIIDRFRAAGITGWRYGMILTESGYAQADHFYLGDSYTNSTDGFLGGDGYNWYPCHNPSQWRTFTEVFARFVNFASPKKTATGCQMLIGEVGCQERDAFDAVANSYECSGFSGQSQTAKANWIADMRAKLKTTHSNIDGFCWFDSDSAYNWWVDTRPGTKNAFKNMGLDAYFGGGSTVSSGEIKPQGFAAMVSFGTPSLRGDTGIVPSGITGHVSFGSPSLTGPGGGSGSGGSSGTPTGKVFLQVGTSSIDLTSPPYHLVAFDLGETPKNVNWFQEPVPGTIPVVSTSFDGPAQMVITLKLQADDAAGLKDAVDQIVAAFREENVVLFSLGGIPSMITTYPSSIKPPDLSLENLMLANEEFVAPRWQFSVWRQPYVET